MTRGERSWRATAAAGACVCGGLWISACDLSYLTSGLTGSGGTGGTAGSGGAGGTDSSGTTATSGGTGGSGGTGASGGTGGATTSSGTGGEPDTDFRFSMSFGDPAVNDDVVAAAGNIRAVGLSNGNILLAFHAAGSKISIAGGKPFSADQSKAVTDQDLVVALVDGTGMVLKSNHFSMPGVQLVTSLAAAGPDGPYYLGGRTSAPLVLTDLGAGVMIANESTDGFVLRLDKKLAIASAAMIGGAGTQNVQSLFVAPDGQVWVGGQAATTVQAKGPGPVGQAAVDLGCGAKTYTPSSFKEGGGVIATLSADLKTCKDILVFGPTMAPKKVDVETQALAVNAAGDLFVAGRFAGTMAVGAAPAITSASDSGFVVRIAAGGKHWAALSESNAGDDRLSGIAVGPDGVVVIGTGATGPLFGHVMASGMQTAGTCVPAMAAGSADGVLLGLDLATGDCKWGLRLSSGQMQTTTEVPRAVAIGQNGEVWATGTFEKLLVLNGGMPKVPGLNNGTTWESFALRWDSLGSDKVPFAQAWAGAGDQVARDLVLLPNGRVAVVGSYTGQIPGGAPALPSTATDPHDYFLVVLDPKYPTVLF